MRYTAKKRAIDLDNLNAGRITIGGLMSKWEASIEEVHQAMYYYGKYGLNGLRQSQLQKIRKLEFAEKVRIINKAMEEFKAAI